MSFTPRPQAPTHYEILYAKDRLLTEEDLQPYLLNLQTQGVTWDTLQSIAEEYITAHNLEYDTNPSGSSLKASCYFYAHTISEFNGTSLKNPTVIYVGISIGEKVTPKTFNSKFSRAFDKSESGRNLFWHGVVANAGVREVHILPIRLEGKPCNEIEIYFIDILGRFCIPARYQGPLVNFNRDFRDPEQQRKLKLQYYEKNPHLKGEGGVISIRNKAIWTDDDFRNDQSKERRQRYLTLTKDQQKAQVEPLKEYWKDFIEWKKDFLKQFAHEKNDLFQNLNDKKIEITADYTKQLEIIQESGYFRRHKRRDFAQAVAEKTYGVNLVFPEYRDKKIEAYLNATNVSSAAATLGASLSATSGALDLDEVNADGVNVFEQCNGYWYPCNKALTEQYKRESSEICDDFPTEESIDSSGKAVPPTGHQGKLLKDATAHIEELGSYDEWVVKVLEPYKHNFDYTTLSYNEPVTDLDYLRKFEEVKKRTDIFATFTNAGLLNKRSGIEYNLIYLENKVKKGPCWAPCKKSLKKLYKAEIARIHKEKWEALEKTDLIAKKEEPKELTLEDLHEWVTKKCEDLAPEQKFNDLKIWKEVGSSPRRINRWRNVAFKDKGQWYSVDKKLALALIEQEKTKKVSRISQFL